MPSEPVPNTGKFFNGSDEGEVTVVATGTRLRTLLAGDNMVIVEALWPKGTVGTWHSHDDHESIGYMVRGRLKLTIGGETRIIEAGGTWLHPQGVEHQGEALEESLHIEVKSPARRTW